jgi:hypothetical protein
LRDKEVIDLLGNPYNSMEYLLHDRSIVIHLLHALDTPEGTQYADQISAITQYEEKLEDKTPAQLLYNAKN